MPRSLALVPARKGSKRLPGKNTKLFLGRPLISWTLDVAIKSKFIDEVIVSSNCLETLDIAKQAGVTEVYFRSAFASSDQASMQDVIAETLNQIGNSRVSSFSHLALLQPTSPLRNLNDIQESFELLSRDPDADCVISYAQRPPNLGDNKRISILENGYMDAYPFEMKELNPPPVYIRNGPAICISKLPKAQFQLIHGRIRGYEMPFIRSIDIDSQEDFVIAEAIARSALDA